MTNPTPLSPAAQAMLDAFRGQFCLCGPYDDNWELCIAAVLRAAAAVVAEDEMDHYAPDILHDIAAELEGTND